ncbi:hypothetical protein [Halococcus saccharolyticus]|uniref:Uncharacterized protein n=1 Tax=Halococcus saccharolyticus DSM 5350 TaxID=1227455 RepID=M0ME32_9EURY|nr:hypothetical protein [Halococcus saccharolyticus]EMA43578.1 hypothetical protein C449_13502 [Halococcus saccharolyticus DSM 5350]
MATTQTTSERASSQESASDEDSTETIEVPERYAREIDARERLHKACPVDVYVAGINPRYSWPNRLVAANEARPSVADSADSVIVDSVVNDPYYAVEDVLDAAHKLDAEYVVGKDWPPESDPAGEGIHAADAYEWFLGEYTSHECEADVIVPIAPPFDSGSLNCLSKVDHFALGGMRDMSGEQQVTHIRDFRRVAGYDVDVHGLGVGTSAELIGAIRESVEDDPEKPLLDSFDISTPENAVSKGKIPDKSWQQHRVSFPTGEDSTTMRAGFAESIARMLEYELSPGCDDEILKQAGFATF